ncbi:MAG: (4Fe-4S)-binding protein [Flavobacteriaceae bacterium]
MEKQKTYTLGAVSVVWKPHRCIHSANCIKALPKVFRPKERPWIQLEGAHEDAVIQAVEKCPSGALTYETPASKNQTNAMEEPTNKIQVNLIENGPAIVLGTVEVTHPDGSVETRERRASFCRCGKSVNHPFCDGSHKNA